MNSTHLHAYMPIFILLLIAVFAFVGAVFIASKILRPHNPSPEKSMAYECGEKPIGDAWSLFNVRFYVVSIVFIIFDVESALMFPVATVYKKFIEQGEGAVLLSTILVFIGVLFVGLIYNWRKGDLEWVKSFQLSFEDEQNN